MISNKALKAGESPYPSGRLRCEPGAGPFATAAWFDSLRQGLSGFDAGVAEVLDSESAPDGNIRAGLPYFTDRKSGWSRLFSLPFGSYGGLYVPEGAEPPSPSETTELILALVSSVKRPLGIIQIVDFAGTMVDPVSEPLKTLEVFTHLLDLEKGFDHVWSHSFHRRVRKFVRQSRRKGVRIEKAADRDGLDRYIAVAKATSARHGNRPYPNELFTTLLFGPGKDHSAVHLAMKDDRVLAGSLHIYGGDGVFNWLTASYTEAWPDRPVQALISHVIEEAARSGYRWYNFGASPPAAAGLIDFKQGFGAFRRDYYIHQYVSPAFRLVMAAGRLIRKVKD